MSEPVDDTDARWCQHHDALALGDDAPPAPTDDPSGPHAAIWGREHGFYAGLASEAAGSGVIDASDHARLDAIFAARASAPARGRAWWWLGVAAAAAVLVLVWTNLRDAAARVSEGHFRDRVTGTEYGPGDALPMAVWLVAADEVCSDLEQARVCASSGTVVQMHARDDDENPELELLEGSVRVSGSVAVRAGTRDIAGSDDASFAVQAAGAALGIEVEQGTVEVRDGTAQRSIAAGEHVQLEAAETVNAAAVEPPPATRPETDDAAPVPATSETTGSGGTGPDDRGRKRSRASPTPKASPAELLTRARGLRGSGDNRGAADAYAELIAAHPDSGEAKAARVSLGQLRLATKPKAALSLFEKYIADGGSLAEEAWWGKIQALHALHRNDARDGAMAELERRFPRSVYVQRARDLAGR